LCASASFPDSAAINAVPATAASRRTTNFMDPLLTYGAFARDSTSGGELAVPPELVDGVQTHGPPPHPLDVLQHSRRAVEVEAAPVARVVVREDQRPVVAQLGHRDARRAVVELGREDRLAQLVDVAARHADLAVGVGLEDEELQLLGEVAVEVVADEAEVVLVAADLARLLHALRLHEVLPDREPEVVRVDR